MAVPYSSISTVQQDQIYWGFLLDLSILKQDFPKNDQLIYSTTESDMKAKSVERRAIDLLPEWKSKKKQFTHLG